MNELTDKQISDSKILARFIQLYCHARHDRKVAGESMLPEFLRSRHPEKNTLCPECAGLLEYGIKKRRLCPLVPKPSCKSCHIHCYSPEYRQTIREIMAYSGKRLILKGRLDYLFHYWFM